MILAYSPLYRLKPDIKASVLGKFLFITLVPISG